MEYQQVVARDQDLCVKCGECTDVCPMDCFDADFLDDFSGCGACHQCIDVCPADAIIVK